MLLNEQIGSSQLGTVFLLHGVLITQDLIQRFETYPNFDSAPTTVIFGREALFLAPPQRVSEDFFELDYEFVCVGSGSSWIRSNEGFVLNMSPKNYS